MSRGGRRNGAGRPRRGPTVLVGQRVGVLVVEAISPHGGRARLRCECGRIVERSVRLLVSARLSRCYACSPVNKIGRPRGVVHLVWGSFTRCGRGLGRIPQTRDADEATCADCIAGAIANPESFALGILRRLRHSARQRSMPVTLSVADVIALRIGKRCAFCDAELGGYPGLDRIDNAKGYERDNVQPCCGHCNFARGHAIATDEFRAAMAVRRSRLGPGVPLWPDGTDVRGWRPPKDQLAAAVGNANRGT